MSKTSGYYITTSFKIKISAFCPPPPPPAPPPTYSVLLRSTLLLQEAATAFLHRINGLIFQWMHTAFYLWHILNL